MPTKQPIDRENRGMLRLQDAAKYLGVSLRTLRTLISLNRIPVIRVSQRRVVCAPEDLDRYIAQQRR